MKENILIVVDMQNDFIDGSLKSPESEALLPRMDHYLNEVLSEDTWVVFTKDTHGEDYLDTQEGRLLPVKHCIKGTEGWEIPSCLRRPFMGSPTVVEKGTFGSFDIMKSLDGFLPENPSQWTITLCGLCTDICVVSNALILKAQYPEATVRIFEDLCEGTTRENHDAAIATMRSCQIQIVNSETEGEE